MSLPYLASLVRCSSGSTLKASYQATSSTRSISAFRSIASSSCSSAQVRDQVSHDACQDSQTQPETPIEGSQKLGKRARKAIRARQRQEEHRIYQETKANATIEAKNDGTQEHPSNNLSSAPPQTHAITRVKDIVDTSGRASSTTAVQSEELNRWRSQNHSSDRSNPTAGWSGSLFRSHISSLLSGFGTAPQATPVPGNDLSSSTMSDNKISSEYIDRDSIPKLNIGTGSVTSPWMTKSERMESQARVIFQAIREARERGMVDEDESFFYPYPEGVPPKGMEGKDAVWLNLGPDPEAWGREIPCVKDKWLEVLSLGLTKEISTRPADSSAGKALADASDVSDASESIAAGDQVVDEYAFEDLVEDYDLEDHERLEQLGDSVVNMSSRLLAYQSFPDINEGSLTRLSNYPTQNNFLALLFQECGLAARRDELRHELRRARFSEDADAKDDDGRTNQRIKSGTNIAERDEETVRLPHLIKRDADMFEAYAAAVFLSHGNDFNVVHEWLCHLFRPFQDQAYRFMVQRKKATNGAASETNLSADGLGIKSASLDASSVSFSSSLFPDFSRGGTYTPIPAYTLNKNVTMTTGEVFITDEFLTVAARARRQRDERLREELRLADQQELMNMGWFRKGFLNLRQGFRQYVMGKDIVLEEEARLRQKAMASDME
uniref:Probable ribonuclease iii n=1 Tax=Melanopsichium pennsylvanicum 4 TaxID=1398559 RepID=A0A077R320_9BASI|nr:probable ribonuclease iii [Melanopsichium pennsylvanicum 4]